MDSWTKRLIADAVIGERQEEAAQVRLAHARACGHGQAGKGELRSISERFAAALPRIGVAVGIRRAGRA